MIKTLRTGETADRFVQATLELIDPAAVPTTEPERTNYLEDGDSWRSSKFGGSPGEAGGGAAVDVVA